MDLTDMVKQITIHYIEFHYEHFIKERVSKPTEHEIRLFVGEMYVKHELDIKKYIRKTLRANLKHEYSGAATEHILLNMFNDPIYAKERIVQEILAKQYTKN